MDELFLSICVTIMILPIFYFFATVAVALIFDVDLTDWLKGK